MKSSLLISFALALLASALLASSAAGRSGGQTLAGFRSPSGNIKCFYNPNGLTERGHTRVLTCSLDRANYAMRLQRRCEAGDWHGFTLTPARRPVLFCPAGASGDHLVYTTVAYGSSWQRGPFTCASRVTGVTCRSRTGHGLFLSRQSYRAW